MTGKIVRCASLIPIAVASALLFGACSSDKSDDSPTTARASISAATSTSTATAAPAITKQQAEQTALATVPGGVLVSSELSQRNGITVWHVHIRNAQGWDYDVNVDAASGTVVPDRENNNNTSTAPPMPSSGATAVTQQQAEQTALATVPGGTVANSELNQRDGKTVWHVHIRNAQGWDYDVNVDAATGVVVPG